MKKAILASVLMLSALAFCLPIACVPISSQVAVQIPGTYNVTFEPLVVQMGGVAIAKKADGTFVKADGSLTVDVRPNGCLQNNAPPEKTICLCEQFKICPQQTDTASVVMTLPNLNRQSNNKTILYVTLPGSSEPLRMEGALDGRQLGLLVGLDAALKAGKVGRADCFSTKASIINGNGSMEAGQFTGTFKGEVAGLWSAGCKFGPVVLAAGLTLKRPYTATKFSDATPIPEQFASDASTGEPSQEPTGEPSGETKDLDAGQAPRD